MRRVRFLVEMRKQLNGVRLTFKSSTMIHSKQVLNGNPDLNCAAEVILKSELEQEPSLEEVCKCLSSLKCGKAAGSSGIVAEMLKAGGQLVAEKLWKFFRRVWEEVEVPKDWESGIVMPLFKKGDRMDLDNYRGIILIDVVRKVFSGILRNRLEKFYEGRIIEEEAGFRKGRGCIDHGYILAQVIQKRLDICVLWT
jgi:hypothetical protein